MRLIVSDLHYISPTIFVYYTLFAFFSAYFTATSLSLNLMQGTAFWLIFVMVFVIAVLAGFCLTEFIKQLQSPMPSKAVTALTLIGFILFWGVSFATNVHYFFVQKHGYTVLNQELVACKTYLEANTKETKLKIEAERDALKQARTASITTKLEAFSRELEELKEKGFAGDCILILKGIEDEFNLDKETYKDQNTYVIYDDERDAGYRGKGKTKNERNAIYTTFSTRVIESLKKKLSVYDAFYNRKISENDQWGDLLTVAYNLEEKDMPEVLQDGSVQAYYGYYGKQNGALVDKMPQDFNESCVEYKTKTKTDGQGNDVQVKKMESYIVYPSKHMFDTFTVWNDILKGYTPGYMRIIQWILLSLLVDVVAFILFYLARRQSSNPF
jgi:hypothetical protein